MDDEELEFLNELPSQFIVFSGNQNNKNSRHRWGMSYWGVRSYAYSISKTYKEIITARCNKKDVRAIKLGQGQFDAVIYPKAVQKITPIRRIRRPVWIEKILRECNRSYKLGQSSFHGLWHWEKVEINAIALAKKIPRCDKYVAWLFALIHDSKRERDCRDPLHGYRSSVYCEQLFNEGKLKISRRQLSKLVEACRYHSDGEVSRDPTIGACWDADRLDLIRTGIIPDANLLSTKAGKTLLCKI